MSWSNYTKQSGCRRTRSERRGPVGGSSEGTVSCGPAAVASMCGLGIMSSSSLLRSATPAGAAVREQSWSTWRRVVLPSLNSTRWHRIGVHDGCLVGRKLVVSTNSDGSITLDHWHDGSCRLRRPDRLCVNTYMFSGSVYSFVCLHIHVSGSVCADTE